MKQFHPHYLQTQRSPAKCFAFRLAEAGAGNGIAKPSPDDIVSLAAKVYSARARRKEFFNASLFSETAWDILLFLYLADARFEKMTVSGLCAASHSPETTALRWLTKLGQLGLIRRQANHLDARIVFIELELTGRDAINAYLSELWCMLFATQTTGLNN